MFDTLYAQIGTAISRGRRLRLPEGRRTRARRRRGLCAGPAGLAAAPGRQPAVRTPVGPHDRRHDHAGRLCRPGLEEPAVMAGLGRRAPGPDRHEPPPDGRRPAPVPRGLLRRDQSGQLRDPAGPGARDLPLPGATGAPRGWNRWIFLPPDCNLGPNRSHAPRESSCPCPMPSYGRRSTAWPGARASAPRDWLCAPVWTRPASTRPNGSAPAIRPAPLAVDREPDPHPSGYGTVAWRFRHPGSRCAGPAVRPPHAGHGPGGRGRLLRRCGPAGRRRMGADRSFLNRRTPCSASGSTAILMVPLYREGDRVLVDRDATRVAQGRPRRGPHHLRRDPGQGTGGDHGPFGDPGLDQPRL